MISGVSELTLITEDKLPKHAANEHQTALNLLIDRALSGDKAAFEQIMIHSQKRVLTLTWRLLGNEADACDASQEVFLRVYKYLGRFNQEQDYFGWLYQITVNTCRDALKQKHLRNSRFPSLDADSETAFDLSDQHENAEEVAIRGERQKLIRAAIATLPAKEREAIVLRDIEGLETAEVARIMSSSSTTVRSQISTARKKIRSYCDRWMKRMEPR